MKVVFIVVAGFADARGGAKNNTPNGCQKNMGGEHNSMKLHWINLILICLYFSLSDHSSPIALRAANNGAFPQDLPQEGKYYIVYHYSFIVDHNHAKQNIITLCQKYTIEFPGMGQIF